MEALNNLVLNFNTNYNLAILLAVKKTSFRKIKALILIRKLTLHLSTLAMFSQIILSVQYMSVSPIPGPSSTRG